MDADANANADANTNADARGSTIALRELCSGDDDGGSTIALHELCSGELKMKLYRFSRPAELFLLSKMTGLSASKDINKGGIYTSCFW